MAGSIVAENYAEALFELAKKGGKLEEYGRLMSATAEAFAASPTAQAVLVSPRVSKTVKGELVGRAMTAAGAPAEFVRYLQAVVKRGRQTMFAQIADAYDEMVDGSFNRVRATVTLARTADQALQQQIVAALGRTMAKEVVTTFAIDPEILGGAIVKVGGRVYDGSVRRRLVRLKRQLTSG